MVRRMQGSKRTGRGGGVGRGRAAHARLPRLQAQHAQQRDDQAAAATRDERRHAACARGGASREPARQHSAAPASAQRLSPLARKPMRPPSATNAPYGSVRQKSCILAKPAGAADADAVESWEQPTAASAPQRGRRAAAGASPARAGSAPAVPARRRCAGERRGRQTAAAQRKPCVQATRPVRAWQRKGRATCAGVRCSAAHAPEVGARAQHALACRADAAAAGRAGTSTLHTRRGAQAREAGAGSSAQHREEGRSCG
jgi:hypothetical protein